MNIIGISSREFRSSVAWIRPSRGFSVIEILVVLGIIVIMAGISLPYIVNYRKAYRSEDQAIKLIDLMDETAQLALTRRRTMRFEIDLTDNAALIIDENGAAADSLIKSIPLDKPAELRIDVIPTGVSKPNPPNYNDAVFAADSLGHLAGSTTVISHTVWAARFQSDGSVINDSGTPVSANIYIWPPDSPGSLIPRSIGEIRAVTMFGGSGSVRYWKHNGSAFVASQ